MGRPLRVIVGITVVLCSRRAAEIGSGLHVVDSIVDAIVTRVLGVQPEPRK